MATLFLNNELRIRRFTAKTTNLFKLLPSDVDRPITDFVSDLDYPEMARDAKAVLKTLVPVEKEVATKDGHWFAVRVMPYRTTDNRIDGLVLTFSDITRAKDLEVKLRKALQGKGSE